VSNALSNGISPAEIQLMPQLSRRNSGRARPAIIAGLLALLFLVSGVIAANEQLHERFHADDSATHGLCSFCSLAKGLLDTPVTFQPTVVPLLSPVRTVPALESAWVAAMDISVASSRGPPASVSSL
jgi:hypothetical protein